jgi:CheY-like chemotaxis protein
MEQEAGTRRKRIIHSDDFVDFTVAMRVFLENEGYEVRCAYNGATTLELVAEWPPDLIITDILKPVMDGWQLLAALKADERTRDIPVMVLSALIKDHPEHRQAAYDLGACVVAAKPIEDYPELARVVAEALGEGGSPCTCGESDSP